MEFRNNIDEQAAAIQAQQQQQQQAQNQQNPPQDPPASSGTNIWMIIGIIFIILVIILIVVVIYLLLKSPSCPQKGAMEISQEDVNKVDAAIAYVNRFQKKVGVLASKGCQPSRCRGDAAGNR